MPHGVSASHEALSGDRSLLFRDLPGSDSAHFPNRAANMWNVALTDGDLAMAGPRDDGQDD